MSVFRYVDTEELEVRNPLFLANAEVDSSYTTDDRDTGLISKYWNGTNVVYTGLFRDASDATYKLFANLQTTPNFDTGHVDITGTGYSLTSLELQDITARGDIRIDGDFTVGGAVTTFNVNTLTVEDNIIIANSGPQNTKEDAGFVIRRPVSSIITDAPKESGTASAAGSVTTITLQAGHGHGSVADYYVGWVVKLGGDVTGSARVTGSSAADPPVLTFDADASGATTTATTYQLFNKQYVGSIWDESTDKVTFYGFPREDLMGVIDPAGDSGNGNLAEYIDTRARDAYVDRDLYIEGVIRAAETRFQDNILAVNAGPVMSEDHGYVSQRSAINVVTQDSPKINNAAIDANYTSGATTIHVTNAATGFNYFKGWVVRYNSDTTAPSIVLTSTEAGGVHTLTLATPFATNLTAGSDTVDLYNKRYVGQIYDESTDTLMSVGFPREEGETVIDPDAPINGNVPDYIHASVKNLTVHGSLYFTGGNVVHTLTLTTAATLIASQFYQYDIIYLNPTANATFTLPTVASMAFPANESKITMFVNISAFRVTIAGNSGNTIEGLPSLTLTRQYSKAVITGSSELTDVWTVKG